MKMIYERIAGFKDGPRSALEERKAKNRAMVAQCIKIAKKDYYDSSIGEHGFEDTVVNRGLFTKVWSHGEMRPPLAPYLLGIHARDFLSLERAVNGKRILLVGGGRSLGDLTSDPRFTPRLILNADRYLSHEIIDHRQAAGYYRSLQLDPTSKDFLTELHAAGYDKFDEIWATWSLPHYCKNMEEIPQYFSNMYDSLGADSYFRTFPIGFVIEDMPPMRRNLMLEALSAGLEKGLGNIAEKDDTEVSIHENIESILDFRMPATLIVHRMKE